MDAAEPGSIKTSLGNRVPSHVDRGVRARACCVIRGSRRLQTSAVAGVALERRRVAHFVGERSRRGDFRRGEWLDARTFRFGRAERPPRQIIRLAATLPSGAGAARTHARLRRRLRPRSHLRLFADLIADGTSAVLLVSGRARGAGVELPNGSAAVGRRRGGARRIRVRRHAPLRKPGGARPAGRCSDAVSAWHRDLAGTAFASGSAAAHSALATRRSMSPPSGSARTPRACS